MQSVVCLFLAASYGAGCPVSTLIFTVKFKPFGTDNEQLVLAALIRHLNL
jgi:hypothetical protein